MMMLRLTFDEMIARFRPTTLAAIVADLDDGEGHVEWTLARRALVAIVGEQVARDMIDREFQPATEFAKLQHDRHLAALNREIR